MTYTSMNKRNGSIIFMKNNYFHLNTKQDFPNKFVALTIEKNVVWERQEHTCRSYTI